MEAERQVQWRTALLHLAYSCCTLLGVAWLLLTQLHTVSITGRGAAGSSTLPDALVCSSAGFFAFQLWSLVHNRQTPCLTPPEVQSLCTALQPSGREKLGPTLDASFLSVFLGCVTCPACWWQASKLNLEGHWKGLMPCDHSSVVPACMSAGHGRP